MLPIVITLDEQPAAIKAVSLKDSRPFLCAEQIRVLSYEFLVLSCDSKLNTKNSKLNWGESPLQNLMEVKACPEQGRGDGFVTGLYLA